MDSLEGGSNSWWHGIDLDSDPDLRRLVEVFYIYPEEHSFVDVMGVHGLSPLEVDRMPTDNIEEMHELGRVINELGCNCEAFGGQLNDAVKLLRQPIIISEGMMTVFNALLNPDTRKEALKIATDIDWQMVALYGSQK